jgi:small neutral amino acid transporter SnatA (MarC family)
MEAFLKATSLLFLLLNPFLMSVYLAGLIRELSQRDFTAVMRRAHVIALFVFSLFAVAGDRVFEQVFNVRFASFLIFGGIVFLTIGLRSVFAGTTALVETQGAPAHVSGAIAMPFMLGPGTVSAAVLAGANQPAQFAVLSVACALLLSWLAIVGFKWIIDHVRARNEELVQRYIEVSGRIAALFTGTYAIEMIVRGTEIILASQGADASVR